MMHLSKLISLIKNPILQTYTNTKYVNTNMDRYLGNTLKLPYKSDLPFLFSCFALSIDGKLCYPDIQSGFSIANNNMHATIAERKADFEYLMVARSISDAVIVGSNMLNLENGTYIPCITIDELTELRINQKQPPHPWTVVICRNLNNLNLSQQLFTDINFPVIICCQEEIQKNNISHNYQIHNVSSLKSQNQLSIKNIIQIDTTIQTMYKTFKQLNFNVILNESPFFHHALLQEKLLDEIWLNYSGSYIGGNITTLGNKQDAFTSNNHPDTEILTLHHLDYHFLYSRLKVLYSV